MRDMQSRYIATPGKYGSWDLHVDTAYNMVLHSLAVARKNLGSEFLDVRVRAAMSVWHHAMDRSMDRLHSTYSTWRNGE